MKCKKEKTIEDYIRNAENFFLFPFILLIVLLIITFVTKYYFLLFFVCIILIYFSNCLYERDNIRRIKKYLVTHDLIDKIGDIYFWNEKDYMLTDNYFIIVRNSKVNIFKYEEISEIYKKMFLGDEEIKPKKYLSKLPCYEYLYITLKSNKNYRVLIWSTRTGSEQFMDISDYLISKNSNIKVIEE